MDVHIAAGTRRTGQFAIPPDRVQVSHAVVRDTGRVLKGDDLPRYSLHKGPGGTYLELDADADEYLMVMVSDREAKSAEPGSKLRAWQKETAAAAGASPAPGAPSPTEE